MKKIIVAIVFFVTILSTFTGCMLASRTDQTSHASHNSETSQHSSGCH